MGTIATSLASSTDYHVEEAYNFISYVIENHFSTFLYILLIVAVLSIIIYTGKRIMGIK